MTVPDFDQSTPASSRRPIWSVYSQTRKRAIPHPLPKACSVALLPAAKTGQAFSGSSHIRSSQISTASNDSAAEAESSPRSCLRYASDSSLGVSSLFIYFQLQSLELK